MIHRLPEEPDVRFTAIIGVLLLALGFGIAIWSGYLWSQRGFHDECHAGSPDCPDTTRP